MDPLFQLGHGRFYSACALILAQFLTRISQKLGRPCLASKAASADVTAALYDCVVRGINEPLTAPVLSLANLASLEAICPSTSADSVKYFSNWLCCLFKEGARTNIFGVVENSRLSGCIKIKVPKQGDPYIPLQSASFFTLYLYLTIYIYLSLSLYVYMSIYLSNLSSAKSLSHLAPLKEPFTLTLCLTLTILFSHQQA